MPLTNREVFATRPHQGGHPEPRRGKGQKPRGLGDWAPWSGSLRSFVCEGEYERGLDRILDQYLSHLGRAEQPAAWVAFLWQRQVSLDASPGVPLARLHIAVRSLSAGPG